MLSFHSPHLGWQKLPCPIRSPRVCEATLKGRGCEHTEGHFVSVAFRCSTGTEIYLVVVSSFSSKMTTGLCLSTLCFLSEFLDFETVKVL